MPLCMPSPITSTLFSSNLLLLSVTAHCTAPTLQSMVEETAHDLPITDNPVDDDARNDSGAKSATTTTSSSATPVAIKPANNKVPKMTDY
jgi:hypothetical protein